MSDLSPAVGTAPVRYEHAASGFGLGTGTPRLSWQVPAAPDEELAPGWTSYGSRLRFRTHDVTGLLREGANTVEVLLGNGWYRGRLGWGDPPRAYYGDRLAASPTPSRSRASRSSRTGCCWSVVAPRGSTPSPWARPRSGSAGTACCPTVRSIPAR